MTTEVQPHVHRCADIDCPGNLNDIPCFETSLPADLHEAAAEFCASCWQAFWATEPDDGREEQDG